MPSVLFIHFSDLGVGVWDVYVCACMCPCVYVWVYVCMSVCMYAGKCMCE